MLFNIFTPDEVDFLKQLVGDDVVEKLEEDEEEVEEEEEEENIEFRRGEDNGKEEEKPEEYVTRESLVSYEHSASVNWGRPSQTKDTPIVSKNALASSQGSERPASNIRGGHEAQSGLAGEAYQPITKGATTVGSRTTTTTASGKASPAGSTAAGGKGKRKDERIRKMESLLGKLSERYKKRTEEPSQVQNMDEAMREAEKTERMKIMIENLKSRLSRSRPGMNRLSLADLDEDLPFVTSTTRRPVTAEPVPINSVESMIGEKIRGMRVGMNRLDLEEVLDLDTITVERNPVTNGDSEPADSFRNPTSVVGPDGGDKTPKPKRQAIHPRLKYHRPDSDIVHRPSINLKSAISPVTAEPYVGNGYNGRRVIGRYQESHAGGGGKERGKYHADSYMADYNARQPYKYPSYPEGPSPPPPVTKELPRLKKGERGDPYPETKELPPYHNPVSVPSHTTETSPGGPIFYTEGSSTDSAPPIFYPDRPSHFDPNARPPPYAGNDRHVPRLPPKTYEPPSYVPSSSYRDPVGKKPKSGRQYGEGRDATSTKYPPPGPEYKPPSLSFGDDGRGQQQAGPIAVTPKNLPAHALDYRYEVSEEEVRSLSSRPHQSTLPARYPNPPIPGYHSTTVPPPTSTYLPSDMSSMKPPYKGYRGPSGSYMSTMSPPKKGYVPPSDKHMSTMAPPTKGYLPPSEKHMSTMAPPTKGYLAPSGKHMSTMAPPTKGYLPPSGKHMSTLLPPTGSYLPPSDKHMSTMAPPTKGYLAPSNQHMSSMAPPHHDYKAPHAKYKTAKALSEDAYTSAVKEYMKLMSLPFKAYLPPDPGNMQQMKAPSKDYQAAGLNPSYVQKMKPPSSGYFPPADKHMQKMGPPKASYHPPKNDYMKHMTVPLGEYLPPEGKHMRQMTPPHDEYHSPKEKYMSEMKPPYASYLPPDNMHIGHLGKNMGPPTSEYQHSPHSMDMKHMGPPNSNYLPPSTSHMKHMAPPSLKYKNPFEGHLEEMLPPSTGYKIPELKTNPHYMKPPSHDYLAPDEKKKEYHLHSGRDMKAMEPPKSDYIPPNHSQGSYMTTMAPPQSGYHSPGGYKSTMLPPVKGYSSPAISHKTTASYMTTMAPPSGHYHTPKPTYMSSMAPPIQEYHSPQQSYVPSKVPPHPAHITPKPSYMSTMMPPAKGYVTLKHEKMSPPDKNYKQPYKDGSNLMTMHVPSKHYLPPKEGPSDYQLHATRHMPPPLPAYSIPEPAHDKHPHHFEYCPHIEPKSGKECYGYNRKKCWSPGVPDLDCPNSAPCCFDGCGNSCLLHKELSHKPQGPKKSSSPISCPKLHKPHDCNHSTDECKNVGESGSDCPYHSVCCFNGCANICVYGHVDHGNSYTSYHIPPNTRYLVPSSEYIPHKAVHRTLDVGHSVGKAKSTKNSPPTYGMEELYSLAELDHAGDNERKRTGHIVRHERPSHKTVNLAPPAHFMPPAQNYISPHHKKLPTRYLPPAPDASLGDGYDLEYMHPPSQLYIHQHGNPKDSVKEREHPQYELPSKVYHPPPAVHYKTTISVQEPSLHKKERPVYALPDKHYLPPLKEHSGKHDKDVHSDPPKVNHLPKEGKSTSNNYKPPKKEYLPPTKVFKDDNVIDKGQDRKGSGYKQPRKEYISPERGIPIDTKGEEEHDSQSYKPPDTEYLPPPNKNIDQHDEKSPEKIYVPPITTLAMKEVLPSVTPPSQKEAHSENAVQYKPPNIEYLPPDIHNQDVKKEITHSIEEAPRIIDEKYLPLNDDPGKEQKPDVHQKPHLPNKRPVKEYLPPPVLIEEPQSPSHSKSKSVEPPHDGYSKSKPTISHVPSQYPHVEQIQEKAHKDTDGFSGQKHIVKVNSVSKDKDSSLHTMPPHSINIQINIPNKDEFNLGHGFHSGGAAVAKSISPIPSVLFSHGNPGKHESLRPSQKALLHNRERLKQDLDEHEYEEYSYDKKAYPKPFNESPPQHADHYRPPEKEYLPPIIDNHDGDRYYHPPKKEYLPPKKVPHHEAKPSYEKPDHYDPPTKDHLHHVKEDNRHYLPPNQEYMPPGESVHLMSGYESQEHYHPPSKDYLAPMLEDQKHYHPPSEEYLPPMKPAYHELAPVKPTYDKPDHYGLPTKDYLDPMLEHQKHYHPPNKDYLPPKNQKHYHKNQEKPTQHKGECSAQRR